MTERIVVLSRGEVSRWFDQCGITIDITDAQTIRLIIFDGPCTCCGK